MSEHVSIDLHCHILPGVDDGSASLRETVQMARQGAADGIELVCATPHVRSDHDVRIAELPGRIALVNEELQNADVAVRVAAGGEVAAPIVGELSDEDLRTVSLGGGGRWVLVEPPAGALDDRIADAVQALAARGFASVIAHPERHLGRDYTDLLAELVTHGALVQVTAAFLLDDSVRPGIVELARRGLVHVLGSDSHSARVGRPVALAAALRVLAATEPVAAHLEWVAETAPLAIVEGRSLSAPFAAHR